MTRDKLQVLNENTLGAENPVLHLIGYRDFQCTLSRSSHVAIRQPLKKCGQWFSFTFRNYPYIARNRYAFDAECAVEAAGKQGRYGEMHHAVFRAQATGSDDLFLSLAESFNLDKRQFFKDSISENVHRRIHLDFQAGHLDGLKSTPAFLINGDFFQGSLKELFELTKKIFSGLSGRG
ncbi:DsbA family protein [Pedobacter sp. 22163]|uniref:DsbA family protein n=1 Tax=Pedobacter sp. 22163 TaxID=3453883 RepID=UPI003F82E95A